MLRLVEKAKCLPVTLTEARKHLSVDSTDRSNDQLLEMLIAAAANDAEMRTGRVFVSSKWEWKPEKLTANMIVEFPLVPVLKVEIFDLNEVLEEGESYTDISGEVVSVSYPSPEPQGEPLRGSLLPLGGFPENYKMILTVGYPVDEIVSEIEQNEAPELKPEDTRYTETKISLVFERLVQGEILPENFSITQNGNVISVDSAKVDQGRVELGFEEGILEESATLEMSFIDGEIYDSFSNFVQPIMNQELPAIVFGDESDFVTPTPNPTETVYESQTPKAVKSWILTRVGTLYNQRSELALRVGASTNAMFPDQFIDYLLYPYKVRFV